MGPRRTLWAGGWWKSCRRSPRGRSGWAKGPKQPDAEDFDGFYVARAAILLWSQWKGAGKLRAGFGKFCLRGEQYSSRKRWHDYLGLFVSSGHGGLFCFKRTSRKNILSSSKQNSKQPSTLRDFNDITAKLSQVYVLVLQCNPSISYASKIMWSLKHFLYE